VGESETYNVAVDCSVCTAHLLFSGQTYTDGLKKREQYHVHQCVCVAQLALPGVWTSYLYCFIRIPHLAKVRVDHVASRTYMHVLEPYTSVVRIKRCRLSWFKLTISQGVSMPATLQGEQHVYFLSYYF